MQTKSRLSQPSDLLVVTESFCCGRILVDARNSQVEVVLRINAVVEFLNLSDEFRASFGLYQTPVLAVAERSTYFSARGFTLADVPVGTFLRVHGEAAAQAVRVIPPLHSLSAAARLTLPVAA